MSVPPTGALIAGKYQLGKLLGQGGYGSVYEGENVDLGKKVAIKLIDRKKKSSPEALARFRREARLAGKIESPHIVQVFDVGEDDAVGLFMVMELLRGEDLRHKLDRVGKIPVESAVDFAHQIACALARAHAAGVLHRDLKPANVFIHQVEGEPLATVKLVDFGIAKLIGDVGDARDAQPLTSFGQTMGTPQYMAPEQVQGFPFDHRVDLWALGAVLYEMVSGRPAFALMPTFQETAVAIVTTPPPPLPSVAPWVPAAVAAVIDKALVRDPSARIADAVTFADLLVQAWPAAFADGRGASRSTALPRGSARVSGPSFPPVSVPPSSRPKLELVAVDEAETGAQPPALVPRASRRSMGIVLVVVVLMAGAAVLGAAAMRSRERPRPAPAAPAPPKSASAPTATAEESASASAAPSLSISSEPKPVPAKAPPTKPAFGAAGVSSEY